MKLVEPAYRAACHRVGIVRNTQGFVYIDREAHPRLAHRASMRPGDVVAKRWPQRFERTHLCQCGIAQMDQRSVQHLASAFHQGRVIQDGARHAARPLHRLQHVAQPDDARQHMRQSIPAIERCRHFCRMPQHQQGGRPHAVAVEYFSPDRQEPAHARILQCPGCMRLEERPKPGLDGASSFVARTRIRPADRQRPHVMPTTADGLKQPLVDSDGRGMLEIPFWIIGRRGHKVVSECKAALLQRSCSGRSPRAMHPQHENATRGFQLALGRSHVMASTRASAPKSMNPVAWAPGSRRTRNIATSN